MPAQGAARLPGAGCERRCAKLRAAPHLRPAGRAPSRRCWPAATRSTCGPSSSTPTPALEDIRQLAEYARELRRHRDLPRRDRAPHRADRGDGERGRGAGREDGRSPASTRPRGWSGAPSSWSGWPTGASPSAQALKDRGRRGGGAAALLRGLHPGQGRALPDLPGGGGAARPRAGGDEGLALPRGAAGRAAALRALAARRRRGAAPLLEARRRGPRWPTRVRASSRPSSGSPDRRTSPEPASGGRRPLLGDRTSWNGGRRADPCYEIAGMAGPPREGHHRHRSRHHQRLRGPRPQPDPAGGADRPRQPDPAERGGAQRARRLPGRRRGQGPAGRQPQEHHLRRQAAHRAQVELAGGPGAAQLLQLRHRRGAERRGGGAAGRQGLHAAADQRHGAGAREEDRRGLPAEAHPRGHHLGAGLLLRRPAPGGARGRASWPASR